MTPERWKKIDQIVQAALERKPEDRPAFLDSVCRGDSDLRHQVESLISYQQDASTFLESPAFKDAAVLMADAKAGSLEGRTISHYKLTRKIGEGGMGAVYLARDTSLDRQVAIKFISLDSAEVPAARKRLVREARAAAKLDHPNICSVYEVAEHNGHSFIVMQYIEGETLAERIKRKPLEIREALDIAVQVADAIAEAHSRGIIHRDIKPQNIMLTARNQAKVMDFGLAKVIRDRSSAESEVVTESLLTEPGTIVGTIPYMSPEQVKGDVLDARSDVFSFGAVLYEMISGHKPFEAENAASLISAILSREPMPLSRYAVNVPAEMERIVRKCLEKNRERRYQTMRDVAIDLENLRSEQASARETARREEMPTARVRAEVTGQEAKRPGIFTSRLALIFYGIAAMLVVAAIAYVLLIRGAPATGQPEINSLAVLPLENLSGDRAKDYLVDGITEALINELAKVSSLRVTSRTSVMHYKGAREPLPEIAGKLNVNAFVEGTVLALGDRVRVTIQLVHGATDKHLWADSYERDVGDVLALQREVARAIVDRIKVKLTPPEQALLAKTSTAINPAALDAYLQGLSYFNEGRNALVNTGRNTPGQSPHELLKTSITHFEQAIRIDPEWALAYAELARANHWLASSGGGREYYVKSREAAQKALELDETIAKAHGALAFTLNRFDWDWAGAERHYKRAIELDPNYSEARHGYALYLCEVGPHEEAIREIEAAYRLDPLTLALQVNRGSAYFLARDYDRSIELMRSFLESNPGAAEAHYVLGRAYIQKSMHEQGLAEIKKSLDLSSARQNAPQLAWAYAATGKREEAIKMLSELSDREKLDSVVRAAAAYVALGEPDRAIEWLERGYEERRPGVRLIKVTPELDSLHSHPRFQALLRRIGFPQ